MNEETKETVIPEIAPETIKITGSLETVNPVYMSDEFTKIHGAIIGENVYRIEVNNLRHYMRKSGRIYKSLTTFLDAQLPPAKHLDNWRQKMTAELGSVTAFRQWMDNVANYGTGLHIAVADYARDGYVDWDEFAGWSYGYLFEMGLRNGTLQSAHKELMHDFAAIVKFFADYNVRVIAVELPVFDDNGIATLIDLVVEMDAKNYDKTPPDQRQRQNAIINLKSGKNGGGDTHAFQMCGERLMFNATYGDSFGRINDVYNLNPNDWKTEPSYTLKNQTKNIESGQIEMRYQMLVTMAGMDGTLGEPKGKVTFMRGVTRFGEDPTDNIRQMSHGEFARLRLVQED